MSNTTSSSTAAANPTPAQQAEQPREPILKFFKYGHLPPHLQAVSKPFHDLAHAMVYGDNVPESGTTTLGPPLPRNPELCFPADRLYFRLRFGPFLVPKNRIWSRKCERRPRSQRAAH
ncbi:MAG TPA: hypothetical protein VF815_09035 [Myxococcaceae bacterium]|jgi:hypothetical protein